MTVGKAESDPTAEPGANEGRARFGTARWVAGAILIVAAFTAVVIFEPQSCEYVTERVVQRACEPIRLTDVRVVGVIALLALLAWPELAEVTAFGLSIKRRVESAERQADALSGSVSLVQRAVAVQTSRLDAQQLAISSVDARTGDIYIGDAAIAQAKRELPGKIETYLTGVTPPSTPRADGVDSDLPNTLDHAAPAALDLLSRWELLSGRLNALAPAEAARFRAVFSDELGLVRAVRNSVAHARPVTVEDIAEASSILVGLMDALGESRSR